MAKRSNKATQVLELAGRTGVVTAAELTARGIHHETLRRLCAARKLVRVGRGLYSLPDGEVTAHHSLVLASKAVPKGIVCLISALRFHEIGTQAPRQVWIAIDRRSAQPGVTVPRLRIVRFSGSALTEGTEVHRVEGASVKVYSPAKTVADCFKYRNKIGLDVALEALREIVRNRRCTIDVLWYYAKICRVAAVMRPYMEAIV